MTKRMRGLETLLNDEYIAGSSTADPYDPSSAFALSAQKDEIEQARMNRIKLLEGWFGGNPTQIYAVGPQAKASAEASLRDVRSEKKALIVLCTGESNSINSLLSTSWWGKEWNEFPPRGERPQLFLFVHKDEITNYLKMLIDYPRDLFVVSHTAEGYGSLRNKALGLLKEKNCASGIILEDDLEFVDSSRILHNDGPLKDQPTEDLLQIMFDLVSADKMRAKKWKGLRWNEYTNFDFIVPYESLRYPISSSNEFSSFSEPEVTMERLRVGENWQRRHPIIALSKNAILISSYDNAVMFDDPEQLFTQKMRNSMKSLQIKSVMLEIKVGKRAYPEFARQPLEFGILNLTPLREKYWKFMVREMTEYEAGLSVIEGGISNMVKGSKQLSLPELTFGALAIYQWARVNIDATKDKDNEVLWNVFNGMYKEKLPVQWANDYIVRKGCSSTHPFRGTLPGKLITLYTERNFMEADASTNIDEDGPQFQVNSIDELAEAFIRSAARQQSFARSAINPKNSRKSYFEDEFKVLPIPPSILRPTKSLDDEEGSST